MDGAYHKLSLRQAREALGVSPLAGAAELRRAFREAAKRAHPDRRGGSAEAFRRVVDAYHRLQAQAQGARLIQPPAVARAAKADTTTLSVPPVTALQGGVVEHQVADGRILRITLPAGLRTGDKVRVGGAELTVAVRGSGDLLVRGDDLWITVSLDPRLLAEGGRIAVDTPIGRRIVWVTRKAGERGLIRLEGQGLPARGRHRQGSLFLRLSAAQSQADSAARTLLRRFAAAWAA